MEAYSLKVPVHSEEDFIISFERTPWNDLFVHVDFNGNWTKSSKKRFLEVWNNICSNVTEPIFAMPFIYDDKMQKFMKILNLIKLADIKCGDGTVRAVHIWRK